MKDVKDAITFFYYYDLEKASYFYQGHELQMSYQRGLLMSTRYMMKFTLAFVDVRDYISTNS
jgi:hypothetical protein